MKTVTVAAYSSTIEAERIADALALEGIDAQVVDLEASAAGFGAQPTVRVLVPANRIAEAREIVSRVEKNDPPLDVDEEELTRLALDPRSVDAEPRDEPPEPADVADDLAVDAAITRHGT
jgi:hypothetical protein